MEIVSTRSGVIVKRPGPPWAPAERSMEMSVPFAIFEECWFEWKGGAMVQSAFPMLTANEREFLISGILPEEWDTMFGEEEDDDGAEPTRWNLMLDQVPLATFDTPEEAQAVIDAWDNAIAAGQPMPELGYEPMQVWKDLWETAVEAGISPFHVEPAE